MGKFLGLNSDGEGKIYYFKKPIRKQILNGELDYSLDSHTSVAHYHGFYGELEDDLNKMEYNPITDKLHIDKLNTKNDKLLVLAECRRLNFKDIVPELIIHSIIDPFVIDKKEVTEEDIGLLKEWILLFDSVKEDVWNWTIKVVGKTIGMTVGSSIADEIGVSQKDGIWDKIWHECCPSYWGYYASFFEGLKDKYKVAIELWERGLVAGKEDKDWYLRGGKTGKMLYRMIIKEHVLGYECSSCRKAAFYLYEFPKWGEILRSKKAFVKQEVQPKDGEKCICQWCKQYQYPFSPSIERVKYFNYNDGNYFKDYIGA